MAQKKSFEQKVMLYAAKKEIKISLIYKFIMKKTILSAALIMAATTGYAQQIILSDGDEANTFKLTFVQEVDLGLTSGTKWANMNVGASKPADYGMYIMWGHTEDCSNINCSYETSIAYNKEISDWQGNTEYDAGTKNWGSYWVTPTKTQMQELVDECTWEWTTEKNSEGTEIYGYKVTSPKNSNSIFLPAAGSRYSAYTNDQGQECYYWSSSPIEASESIQNYRTNAYYLVSDSTSHSVTSGLRTYAYSIRPVFKQ